MNRVILIGRMCNEPEIKEVKKDTICASGTIAVYRDKDNTDFIRFSAFGKCAELIEDYVKKGDRFGIEGEIRSGSFETKDGEKKYYTNVIVSKVEFLESKKKEKENDGFEEIYYTRDKMRRK